MSEVLKYTVLNRIVSNLIALYYVFGRLLCDEITLHLNARSIAYPPTQVHPIFVLSVADAMLALLYILGGIVWLRREANVSSRVWCFSAALPTVVRYRTNCSGILLIRTHLGRKKMS